MSSAFTCMAYVWNLKCQHMFLQHEKREFYKFKGPGGEVHVTILHLRRQGVHIENVLFVK